MKRMAQGMTKRLLTLLAAGSLLAPSLATAQRVEYYHVDALGSVRAVTDEQGEVLERHDYLPFGEEWNPQPSGQPRKFTGKERDQETGWDYFGARYYEASLARFTSLDPVTTFDENRVDPQRWNRYGYVRNNPMRYVDPDGQVIETAWDAFNIGLGVASFVSNVREGNYLSAAVDGGGLLLDSGAAALPFIPGGFGAAIKGVRVADKAADLGRGAGIVNRGGRFADLDKAKLAGEIGHHVPQNAFNRTRSLSRRDGPAIGITIEDHRLTRTFAGRGRRTMRQDAELNSRQRLAQDVQDLRSQFGSRYNRGSLEAIEYSKTLPEFAKTTK
jgi:RHS repeat-associated protein